MTEEKKNTEQNELLKALVAHGRPTTRADLLLDHRGIESVSMIALIANPEAYHGKTIRVIGFLHLGFEHNAIYLHREDFDRSNGKNALWIDAPEEADLKNWGELSERHVLCEGTFNADNLGHMSLNSGAINAVRRLEVWLGRADVVAGIDESDLREDSGD